MKLTSIRAFLTALVIFGGAMLAGCATNAPQPIQPAQIIAIACPPVLASIQQFEALDATMPTVPWAVKADANLHRIQPAVVAACGAGVKVSLANVQVFAQTVLPALGEIAATVPMPAAQLAQIEAGLTAAEIAVGAANVIQQEIQAQKVQASPVLPAKAPGTSAH